MGPFFPKLILVGLIPKTRATRLDRDINSLKVVFHNTNSLFFYSHNLALCLSLLFVDLYTSSSISQHFNHYFASSSPPPLLPSLRFDLSMSSLKFVYIWNCYLLLFLLFGFVDLFFGFVDVLFGFVDLLILFIRNQALVFDLCISVEIKSDHRPLEPNSTRPIAICS